MLSVFLVAASIKGNTSPAIQTLPTIGKGSGIFNVKTMDYNIEIAFDPTQIDSGIEINELGFEVRVNTSKIQIIHQPMFPGLVNSNPLRPGKPRRGGWSIAKGESPGNRGRPDKKTPDKGWRNLPTALPNYSGFWIPCPRILVGANGVCPSVPSVSSVVKSLSCSSSHAAS